jgi:hypothetical protein
VQKREYVNSMGLKNKSQCRYLRDFSENMRLAACALEFFRSEKIVYNDQVQKMESK